MTSSRLILCAGIPRSASTWIYNVVRLGLSEFADIQPHAAWIDDYQPDHPAPVHVVKIHEPDDTLADRAAVVFTSRRDLRDIAASLAQRDWADSVPSLIDMLRGAVQFHRYWRPRAAFELVYETFLDRRDRALTRLLSCLDLHPSEPDRQMLDATIDQLDFAAPRSNSYDPVTLLHDHHRQDGRAGYFRQLLAPDLVQKIEHEFADWLTEFEYLSPTCPAPGVSNP